MNGFDIVRASRHAGRGLFYALAELGSARMAPPRDARDAIHRLAGALGAIARAHSLAVTVTGDIPRGRALIVANHVSYLDPLAILPRCPAAPLAKSEVEAWPIVGPIGKALGVQFVSESYRAIPGRHLDPETPRWGVVHRRCVSSGRDCAGDRFARTSHPNTNQLVQSSLAIAC